MERHKRIMENEKNQYDDSDEVLGTTATIATCWKALENLTIFLTTLDIHFPLLDGLHIVSLPLHQQQEEEEEETSTSS